MHMSKAGGAVINASVSVLLFLVPVIVVTPAAAQTRADKAETLAESPLQRETSAKLAPLGLPVRLDSERYQTVREADTVLLLGFPLDADTTVDLELERVEVFTPDAVIVAGTPNGDVPLPRPDVTILSGRVVDVADSRVFLGLSPHGNNGLIEIGDDLYVVTAGAHRGTDRAIVYNLAALPAEMRPQADWECAIEELYGGQMPERAWSDVAVGAVSASAVSRRIDLAIETDREFTSALFGGNMDSAASYAGVLIGAASEIYLSEIQTELAIDFLRLWPDSNDPWDQSNTSQQLQQFRQYWNSFMTHVERDAVHFLSGRNLGGGIAYLGAICEDNFDYGLSANLDGTFPYPLQDNHSGNWDIMVVSHEIGHNVGAPHTHDMNPPVDGCGLGDCTPSDGTIMSYCHQCPGGLTNIALRFAQRIKDEEILPFLNFQVSCDLSAEPPACGSIATPLAAVVMNRHIGFTSQNPDVRTAVRVTFVDVPPPNEHLEGSVMWAGVPMAYPENSGQADAGGAGPTYTAAPLNCSPVYVAWGNEPVYLHHEALVPGGQYQLDAILLGCDTSSAADFSLPIAMTTALWGDAVGSCGSPPCTAPNCTVDVVDVLALLNKFQNLPGAPTKPRCDLEPPVLNRLINVGDVLAALGAFEGNAYPFSAAAPCP